MESFLSTLPSYVHDYLNKQPPTDVFNVLRELICFAVLYSNDRERIASRTTELLEKGADRAPDEKHRGDNCDGQSIKGVEDNQDNHDSSAITITHTISTATDKEQAETNATQEHAAAAVITSREGQEEATAKTKPRDRSNLLYTFPEWWGHHDGTEEKNDTKITLSHEPETIVDETRRSTPCETVDTWVPWDDPAKKMDVKVKRRTVSLVASDLIPNLRSYPDPPKRSTANLSPPAASRATMTPKTTPPSKRSSIQVSPSSARNSKTPNAAATAPKGPSSAGSASTATTSAGRTSSTYRPAMTATVRARLEHAKAREQKLEEEKAKAAAMLNRTSLRFKQQARPSVDWGTVKKERRKTMPVMPTNT